LLILKSYFNYEYDKNDNSNFNEDLMKKINVDDQFIKEYIISKFS